MSPEEIFERNIQYAKRQNTYQTELPLGDQIKFAKWQIENKVPYDPSPTSDYDMTGFYKALQGGDPRAVSAVNQNDGMIHYPDIWKTPYHRSFSRDSQWATDGAPSWNEKDQLVLPNGIIIYDERAK